jgi:hypothetical protein
VSAARMGRGKILIAPRSQPAEARSERADTWRLVVSEQETGLLRGHYVNHMEVLWRVS